MEGHLRYKEGRARGDGCGTGARLEVLVGEVGRWRAIESVMPIRRRMATTRAGIFVQVPVPTCSLLPAQLLPAHLLPAHLLPVL